jgi:ankyrin repeat protein
LIPDTGKVRLLLEHRADPNIEDESGITPLRYAIVAQSLETAALLVKAGASTSDSDLRLGNSTADFRLLLEQAKVKAASLPATDLK